MTCVVRCSVFLGTYGAQWLLNIHQTSYKIYQLNESSKIVIIEMNPKNDLPIPHEKQVNSLTTQHRYILTFFLQMSMSAPQMAVKVTAATNV